MSKQVNGGESKPRAVTVPDLNRLRIEKRHYILLVGMQCLCFDRRLPDGSMAGEYQDALKWQATVKGKRRHFARTPVQLTRATSARLHPRPA